MTSGFIPEPLAPQGRAIFLLRHGETATDGVKRFIGQTDLPLSPRGREQAQRWGRFFREVPLAAVVSSDLARARETADLVRGGRDIPRVIKPGFRELSLGSWENMPFAKLREQAPGEFQKRGQAIDTYRPPGGESFLDLQQRAVSTFYDTIAETTCEAEDNLLIVAHAGLNRVLLCHLLGMPVVNLFRLGQAYACLNTITQKDNTFQVLRFNQRLDTQPA